MILGVERSGINDFGWGFWVELGFFVMVYKFNKGNILLEHAWKLFQVQGSLYEICVCVFFAEEEFNLGTR
jgi:hypothetical protein